MLEKCKGISPKVVKKAQQMINDPSTPWFNTNNTKLRVVKVGYDYRLVHKLCKDKYYLVTTQDYKKMVDR